jgi:hypothetical protein
MSDSEFVAYVGIPDIHDGVVLRASVEEREKKAEVIIKGDSGCEHAIVFEGVAEVKMNAPEGMVLYALSEMRTTPPLRRFEFVNSNDDDENDTRSLSVVAKDFRIHSK